MKNIIMLFVVSLAIMSNVNAQETKQLEIFSGLHLAHHETVDISTFGWNVSVESGVNEWLTLVGEVSGTYGDVLQYGLPVPVSAYSFTLGPQVNFRPEGGKLFVRASVGGLHGLSQGVSGTEVVLLVGAGIDVDISEQLAFRVIDLSYSRRLTGGRVDAIRVSMGPVFRF